MFRGKIKIPPHTNTKANKVPMLVKSSTNFGVTKKIGIPTTKPVINVADPIGKSTRAKTTTTIQTSKPVINVAEPVGRPIIIRTDDDREESREYKKDHHDNGRHRGHAYGKYGKYGKHGKNGKNKKEKHNDKDED